jgi:hypothetical protein
MNTMIQMLRAIEKKSEEEEEEELDEEDEGEVGFDSALAAWL